jgi:CRP-like cAMP-binding protein
MNNQIMNALFECINQYHPLNGTAKQDLENVLVRVNMPKTSFIINEGIVCNQLYFLEKGCLRGFYNLDGKEVSSWFAFENNFVTSFYSFISRKPSIENIQLIEDCQLWSVSFENLQQLYDRHQDIERMVRIINERYYVMLEERLNSAQFKTAKERYEQLLETSPHMLQRIPLGYIASYLGISQETLSRIRGKI